MFVYVHLPFRDVHLFGLLDDDLDRRALDVLAPVMAVDDNLYEIDNLGACLLGLGGDMGMMRKHLTKCRRIAPRDGIIVRNHAALAKVEPGGFSAFLRGGA